MTKAAAASLFSRLHRFAAAATLAGATALTACVSDPVPTVAGARDTDTFPNLNIVPRGETEQFTASDRQAKVAELSAIRARTQGQARGGPNAAETQRLRRVGATHADEALREIEASE